MGGARRRRWPVSFAGRPNPDCMLSNRRIREAREELPRLSVCGLLVSLWLIDAGSIPQGSATLSGACQRRLRFSAFGAPSSVFRLPMALLHAPCSMLRALAPHVSALSPNRRTRWPVHQGLAGGSGPDARASQSALCATSQGLIGLGLNRHRLRSFSGLVQAKPASRVLRFTA